MIIHKDKIIFLGMGKFGTAIAHRLDLTDRYKICFYARNEELVLNFNQNFSNSNCFSNFKFSSNTTATSNILEATNKANIIFITVSSSNIVEVVTKLKSFIKKNVKIILCSKGINENYPFFYTEIIKQILDRKNSIYVFSGPNFADEIMSGELSITTMAGKSLLKTKILSLIFRGTNIKIEVSNDVIGVQLFGAMKNVMAITVGILEGLGFGKNRIIRTMMHFVSETQRLSKFYKAKKNTAYLAAGIGDIMLTCFDEKSRNKKFGIEIGKGKNIQELLQSSLVEGYYAVKAIREMCNQIKRFNKKSLAYINAIYDILYKNKDPFLTLNNVEKGKQNEK